MSAKFRSAACAEDSQSLISILSSPEFDINLSGPAGTLLHWSIWNQKRRATELLVQYGIKMNAIDNNGRTALHAAAIMDDDYAYRLLLEREIDSKVKDNIGFTAGEYKAIAEFHNACMNDDVSHVQRLFSLSKANPVVKRYTNEEMNALQLAASYGKHRIVSILLTAGADPNIKNSVGWTALHFAADRGFEESVEALLCNGKTSVDCEDVEHATPLCLAAAKNHSNICLKLLQHKANPNIKCDNGNSTPLHLLVSYNKHCLKTAEVLLKYGANPRLSDKNGDTPLTLAEQRKDKSLVELLSTGKLSTSMNKLLRTKIPTFERISEESDKSYFLRKWKDIRSQDALEWIFYNLIDKSDGITVRDRLLDILGAPNEKFNPSYEQWLYYSREKDYYISLIWSGFDSNELESCEAGRIE